MPGLNIIQRLSGSAGVEMEPVERALASIGLPDYSSVVHLATESLAVTSRAYPGYPLAFWEDERFYYLIEGCIYGWSQEQQRAWVCELAEAAFLRSAPESWLARSLLNTDGDFVVWIAEKATGRTLLMNDQLARLPVFYSQRGSDLLVSRDSRFVLKMRASFSLDPLGLAQHLAFGHGLQGRSPWSSICILPPAALLTTDPHKGRFHITELHTRDFGEKRYRCRSAAENGHQLAHLFKKACIARAGLNEVDVVSLSGGLDSRSIAAALAADGLSFVSATMGKESDLISEEVQTARTVAFVLESPWHFMVLGSTSCGDALELLRLKSGLNSLEMAFILPFFKRIKEVFGSSVTYFSGEGGDRTLGVIHAPRPLMSLDDLVSYIFGGHWSTNFQLRVEDAAVLTGCKKEDLRDSMAHVLAGYPEESLNDRLLHYKIMGRAIGSYNQAEDRNRSYFWCASPFYATQFFDYAFNCPDSQKAAYLLYRHVLTILSPQAAAVTYAGWGGPLGSGSFMRHYYITRLKKTFPGLSRRMKLLIKGEKVFPESSEILQLALRQLESCSRVADYLDPACIRRILDPRSKHHRTHVMKLITAMSLIEEAVSPNPCLAAAPQAVFF